MIALSTTFVKPFDLQNQIDQRDYDKILNVNETQFKK